jgi:hypothetical protein
MFGAEHQRLAAEQAGGGLTNSPGAGDLAG